MGPQRVKSVIKDALARGADRAIHVAGDNLGSLSPYAGASVLAEAIPEEKPDLVFTGLQSDDYGYGQTGVILAELLGLPHATIAIEVDASGEKLRVKRELESGWYHGTRCNAACYHSVGHKQFVRNREGSMRLKKKKFGITPRRRFLASFAPAKREKISSAKNKQPLLGNGDAKAAPLKWRKSS